MTAATRRVQLEPGFLLHHYPWRDSSRILEVLTLSHGRVALFARAARRSGSGLPAALQPFAELLVSWSGRGEAVRMTAAERAATAQSTLAGERLMSGFYANELVIRLLPRNDPHPELGYALNLDGEAGSGRPLDASRSYRYRLDAGAERLDGVAEGSLIFSGASLLALAREELDEARSLADARRLLRAALEQYLDGRELRTRDVLREMRAHAAHDRG